MPFIHDKENYSKHLFILCRIASLFGLIAALGWLVLYIGTQNWEIVACLLVLGIAILPCWLIARGGNFTLGLILSQFVSMIFIVFFSLVFDLPDDTIPRTTHLFLLVIAMVGYINFQREKSPWQLTIIVLSLLIFVLLCSTSLALPLSTPLSETFRTMRAWCNAILATGMLCGAIAAQQSGFIYNTKHALEIQSALLNNQFELFYQPQIRRNQEIAGAEALLRWKHPKRGYIPPSEFIPFAEYIGFMPRLGSWVISEACRTLVLWQQNPHTCHLTLSVNITAAQFAEANFVEQIKSIVSAQKINPRLLKLELTESVFLEDIDTVIEKMYALETAGFSISLDDFGTGYSSLSYLRQLPLKQLKIDRSFVSSISENQRAAAIVKNIVQMGHDLSLDVLAEGVETEEQLRIMHAYGCQSFQGFLFAKPMPFEEFHAYVKQRPYAEKNT